MIPALYDQQLLVNKSWAAEGISVLWRYPPVTALASIKKGRRQFYARQVRELDFAGSDDGKQHERFRFLEFPRLKRIAIDFCHPENGRKLWLGQYIQRNLEDFVFYGANPTEDILSLLESRCPRLRGILIDWAIHGLDTNRLFQFFNNCKSLMSIWLPSFMNYYISDQILTLLVARDGLVALELGKYITYDAIKQALEHIECPFKDIQHLTLHLQSKAVIPLAAAIQSVVRLELTIEDSEFNVLPMISSLNMLRILELRLPQEWDVPGADILALKKLKNLRILSIETWSSLTLTDQEFISLVKDLGMKDAIAIGKDPLMQAIRF
jgi:hypothetical protein